MTDRCSCGNDYSTSFWKYKDKYGHILGVFCRCCQTEWLSDTVLPRQQRSNRPAVPALRLYKTRPLPGVPENNTLLVQSSRVRILDLHQLAIGDHIAFHRPYVIWHHCILCGVHPSANTLDIINWQEENGSVQICQQTIDVSRERGDLYKIVYTSDVERRNSPYLVLARAKSRLQETGYRLFDDNCESFATFCKTGIIKSHQVIWLTGKIWECLVHFAIISGKMAVQVLCKLGRVTLPCTVTISAVVFIEGLILVWDVTKAYRARRNGHLSRNEYAKIAITRITDSICTVLLTVSLSLIGISIGMVLGPLGVIAGGIAGGVLGISLGKVGGTILGAVVGKAITSSLKTDDKAVEQITDLSPGDHVVLCKWTFHPRCHAILVDHDSHKHIKVVRNTYKYGVIEEWLPFRKPVFLVTHIKEHCFPKTTVVTRARGQLGATRYNIATHNCKTFANWCKRR